MIEALRKLADWLEDKKAAPFCAHKFAMEEVPNSIGGFDELFVCRKCGTLANTLHREIKSTEWAYRR